MGDPSVLSVQDDIHNTYTEYLIYMQNIKMDGVLVSRGESPGNTLKQTESELEGDSTQWNGILLHHQWPVLTSVNQC